MEPFRHFSPRAPLSGESGMETTFDGIYTQILIILQREGRVSYPVLKQRFALDDDFLADLKCEIITAKQLARDEGGEVLVWIGNGRNGETRTDSELRTPHSGLMPAQRRQLTVMFCDLVGSTTLAGQLDLEELREVLRTYQRTCAHIVSQYEGYIAQYLGDGLLVYFGYPAAHEDDARRAVRASLDIVAALQKQGLSSFQGEGQGEGSITAHPHSLPNPLSKGQKGLHVRIGIHTGLVVIGEVGSGDTAQPLAFGETPHLAARLQSIAEPDTVVVTQDTQRLVEGYFRCRYLGVQSLRGVVHPVEIYQVLSENLPGSWRLPPRSLL